MISVNKGRNSMKTLILIVILIDIILIVNTSIGHFASDRIDLIKLTILQGIIRLIITIILLFFLYKGYRWAKWVFVVLFLLGGIGGLLVFMLTLKFIYLVSGMSYIVFSIMTITSKNINVFMKSQRGYIVSELE